MTTNTISNRNNFFTISLTKIQLDSIQKQFLEEMYEILDKVRKEVK